MIIPFFIPHAGCPHQCVFCNQTNITGQDRPASARDVAVTIDRYLASRTGSFTPINDHRSSIINPNVHLAFYGGSFTALPLDEQEAYLQAARPFIESGRIADIRLSTRPDCISGKVLDLLARYRVKTVELGVQSMDDRVLALAGRGHTARDTVNAVALLREYRFTVGLQLMPGLPGDSADLFRATVDTVIGLKPDFVRLYPALVIKGTPLERLFRSGKYDPLPLDAAVSTCREAYTKFEGAGISVVRMGLQPTEELERPGTILAGPYHPAFGQLVESSIFLDKMRALLREGRKKRKTAVFGVNPREVSAAVGQRRENIERLKQEFGLGSVRIVEGRPHGGRGEVTLLSDDHS
jgi:histone acetyltransferase (RNA polymerase elongator complex component)